MDMDWVSRNKVRGGNWQAGSLAPEVITWSLVSVRHTQSFAYKAAGLRTSQQADALMAMTIPMTRAPIYTR